MAVSVQGKVVWITGASSGIGEQLAYVLAERGARLILSARREAELQRVRQRCSGDRDQVMVLPLDLSVPTDLTDKARSALGRWSRIDILVHNAGLASRAMAMETGLEVVRTVMETNFFGPLALTKAVLPSMLDSRVGHVVVVGSLSGKYGVPKLSAYAAAKHALHGYFESLRMELEGSGVRISFVIPGFVNTSIISHAIDGTGRPYGSSLKVNDEGMAAEVCARRIVRAIEQGRQETLIGGIERWSVLLHRLMPSTFNTAMSHHPIRRLRDLLRGKWRSPWK